MTRQRQNVMVACATASVLVGMVVASLGPGRDGGRRERLERFLAEHMRQRAAMPTQPRPLLYGDVIEEHAEHGYAMAAVMLGRANWMVRPSLQGLAPESIAARAAAWPALQPIVLVLQRATHLATAPACVARYSYPRLEHVLMIAREHAADHGDWRQCVTLWLDRATIYLDHRRADDGCWRGSTRRLRACWSKASRGSMPGGRAAWIQPSTWLAPCKSICAPAVRVAS